MLNTNWKETKIYKALVANYPNSDSDNLLNRPEVMDKIQAILNDKTTTPKDFTLHDADHSFRVAEMMWLIIPSNTQNSVTEFELCLLLLSAYLHDIGMSPEFDTVIRHKTFLTTEKKDTLSTLEVEEFQKWIDNNDKTKSIDIRKEKIDDTEDLATYILTYYIRSKHNDWSESWIKKHLNSTILKGYSSWVDDTILICKSHHFGLDHLKSDEFDPKPVGNNSRVHIRYLSICLRIADVMENDPKRTPDVIFNHRSISPDSVKYWLKDKQFALRQSSNIFTVYARPTRAYLHRAIEETADLIENELKICSELIRIKPLDYSTFEKLDNYNFSIEPIVFRDISPHNNSYIFIQGGFRPNTSKILELLGGSQLYGSPIWAYRELIQNAFDATKERIAYSVVNESVDPIQLENKLGNLYSINLKLEKRQDGYWLVCKDQGVGMTKNIIEKFFLESGSSKRHEISELERRCNEKKYYFGRTGQFGIGVLSYFMIAEKIIVKTKRDLNTGYSDSESKALRFEINGTHDFGELQNLDSSNVGTQIEMKLRPDIEDDIENWDRKFLDLLREIISKSPCNLSYTSLKNDLFELKCGWIKDESFIKKLVLKKFTDDAFSNPDFETQFISEAEKNQRLSNNILAKEALKDIGDNLKFLFSEGIIPGVGKYRIFIPYFKLKNGYCLAFMKENIKSKKNYISKINKGFFWLPQFDQVNYSLKGINISLVGIDQRAVLRYKQLAYIEMNIDQIDNSALSVSRHKLKVGNNFNDYLKLIDSEITRTIKDNINLFDNCYGSINRCLTNEKFQEDFWLFETSRNKKSDFLWSKITYPITTGKYFYDKHEKMIYNGKILKTITLIDSYSDRRHLDWFENKMGDYIFGRSRFSTKFYFGLNSFTILLKSPNTNEISGVNLIKMPTSWKEVLFISEVNNNSKGFLNINHSMFRFFDQNIFNDLVKNGIIFSNETLDTPEKCFPLLMVLISRFTEDKWIALCERNKDHINLIFTTLKFGYFIIIYKHDLVKVTSKTWVNVLEKDYTKILPKFAGEEFSVEIQN